MKNIITALTLATIVLSTATSVQAAAEIDREIRLMASAYACRDYSPELKSRIPIHTQNILGANVGYTQEIIDTLKLVIETSVENTSMTEGDCFDLYNQYVEQ